VKTRTAADRLSVLTEFDGASLTEFDGEAVRS